MLSQKLAIVPVTLDVKKETSPSPNSTALSPDPVCTVKAAGIEISFFHGASEHIIQTVIKELRQE
ncbi:hypothetical protein ACFQPF_11485 [Fictibacillus iocasae]|uniref:Transposase n=1 Tax=Fictibacillus iocasae TaxID=2715437 RepID=A0ABW2NSS7_9BACL